MGENANLGASRPTLPRPARAVPPYHTGKVQIGLTYVPRQRPHMDRDALRLQRALLGERAATDWDGIGIVAGVALLIAVLAIVS